MPQHTDGSVQMSDVGVNECVSVRGQPQFCLPPCGSRELNSCPQAWWQAPLSPEPSRRPFTRDFCQNVQATNKTKTNKNIWKYEIRSRELSVKVLGVFNRGAGGSNSY